MTLTQTIPTHVAKSELPFMYKFALILILAYINLDVITSVIWLGFSVKPSLYDAIFYLLIDHRLAVTVAQLFMLSIPVLTAAAVLFLFVTSKKCPACKSKNIPKSKGICYNCWQKSEQTEKRQNV